jgi:hypothetical protein
MKEVTNQISGKSRKGRKVLPYGLEWHSHLAGNSKRGYLIFNFLHFLEFLG